MQPLHGRFRTGIAPQHRFIVVGRQRDVDAFESFDEYRARPRQISTPAARAKISVEGDFHALLPHHLDEREKAADARIRIERKGDAGEIDELCFGETLGHAAPVRKLEQLARGGFAAPIMAVARAVGLAVDHREAGQAAAQSQHEIAGNPLRRGEREDGIGIGIVPERRRKGDIEAGAGEINRHVERVAGAADAESAITAAHQLDDRFSHRDDAGLLLAHGAAR